ncbi:Immunogenic miracidial antigen 8I [Schistosoma japonicum]|uniref:Immunogenic miracidial antigen 8I n=1 Tax=Schistosoma japonicum TaxID=6182 RepID=A0A4Z2DQJ7_SCHJA|nr:Immunogenic miracidial antigen 8I [Schistosoma japonicum]
MHLCEFTISCSSPVISTGQHIDVGDEDYHDGDDDVDYTDDVDDVDDSHGSPSQLLQGGYQRNQHYGGDSWIQCDFGIQSTSYQQTFEQRIYVMFDKGSRYSNEVC